MRHRLREIQSRTCGSLALVLGLASVLPAATERSGAIVDETWTAAMSPVRVLGDLLIAGLTIEPGVDVEFGGSYEMVVAGSVRAAGTAEQPIRFRGATAGGWKGIRFQDTGAGSELIHCQLSGATNSALFLDNSRPVVRNCLFSDSRSPADGGGVRITLATGELRIEDCRFDRNFAEIRGGGLAAILGATAHLVLQRCNITANTVGTDTSTHHSYGGGAYVEGSAAFVRTDFSDNVARAYTIFAASGRGTYGAAVHTAGDTRFEQCRFSGNACLTSAHSQTPDRSYAVGGALRHTSGPATVVNCLFLHNAVSATRTHTLTGSAIALGQGELTITNSTFSGQLGAPPVENQGGILTVQNSVLYFNHDGTTQISGPATVIYCDVESGFAGAGNLDLNPVFAAGSFALLPGSPTIDAGDPDPIHHDGANPPGLGSERNDPGYTGGPLGWIHPAAATCPPLDASARCGDIVDETWTAAMSPIRVVGNIQIAGLTIEPGVDVEFAGNLEMVVAGSIRAAGTTEQPIRFLTRAAGGWKGIRFQDVGEGSELIHCRISGATNSALVLDRSRPVVRHCVFSDSHSPTDGGGIRVNLDAGELRFEDCIFARNYAGVRGGGIAAFLGATARLELQRCVIDANTVGTDATTYDTFGAGAYVEGTTQFTGTVFSANVARAYTIFTATGRGTYGAAAHTTGDTRFEQCRFSGNACLTSAHSQTPDRSYAVGGALRHISGPATVVNCLFLDNAVSATRTRTLTGSAISLGQGELTITNSTFSGQLGAPPLDNQTGTLVVQNSILYFNHDGTTQISGAATVSYCDVESGFAGEGNLDVNPVFAPGAFALMAGSAAIDAGRPDAPYQDTLLPPSLGTLRNDLGYTGGPLAWLQNPAPAFRIQPVRPAATAGDTIMLEVYATGDDLDFQWQKDGADIPGATSSRFSVTSTQRFHAGQYAAVVTNPYGISTSIAVTLAVSPPAPNTARLLNLSTRAQALTGTDILIPGFVVNGTANKRLLIRAVGPTLGGAPYNVPGTLDNPRLALKRLDFSTPTPTYVDIAANDDWQTNANAAAITQTAADLFAFPFADDREAALLVDLAPGQYTVFADGVADATGIAIAELYDADPSTGSGQAPASTLINISNRGFVGTGAQVMIPGFVVSSEGPKTLLIRVIGPTLAPPPYNVAGTMADPRLQLFRKETNGSDTLLLEQDNWGDNPDAAFTASTALAVGAFALASGSADAAFVVTLPPGVYTVVGSAADGTSTGVVLVEVYVVP